MSRRAANRTSTAKAHHTSPAVASIGRKVTVRTAEIAGVAGVLEAAVVDVVVEAAVDATAAVVAADATVDVADQVADGTNIRRIHRQTQIKKGHNASCGLFRLQSASGELGSPAGSESDSGMPHT